MQPLNIVDNNPFFTNHILHPLDQSNKVETCSLKQEAEQDAALFDKQKIREKLLNNKPSSSPPSPRLYSLMHGGSIEGGSMQNPESLNYWKSFIEKNDNPLVKHNLPVADQKALAAQFSHAIEAVKAINDQDVNKLYQLIKKGLQEQGRFALPLWYNNSAGIPSHVWIGMLTRQSDGKITVEMLNKGDGSGSHPTTAVAPNKEYKSYKTMARPLKNDALFTSEAPQAADGALLNAILMIANKVPRSNEKAYSTDMVIAFWEQVTDAPSSHIPKNLTEDFAKYSATTQKMGNCPEIISRMIIRDHLFSDRKISKHLIFCGKFHSQWQILHALRDDNNKDGYDLKEVQECVKEFAVSVENSWRNGVISAEELAQSYQLIETILEVVKTIPQEREAASFFPTDQKSDETRIAIHASGLKPIVASSTKPLDKSVHSLSLTAAPEPKKFVAAVKALEAKKLSINQLHQWMRSLPVPHVDPTQETYWNRVPLGHRMVLISNLGELLMRNDNQESIYWQNSSKERKPSPQALLSMTTLLAISWRLLSDVPELRLEGFCPPIDFANLSPAFSFRNPADAERYKALVASFNSKKNKPIFDVKASKMEFEKTVEALHQGKRVKIRLANHLCYLRPFLELANQRLTVQEQYLQLICNDKKEAMPKGYGLLYQLIIDTLSVTENREHPASSTIVYSKWEGIRAANFNNREEKNDCWLSIGREYFPMFQHCRPGTNENEAVLNPSPFGRDDDYRGPQYNYISDEMYHDALILLTQSKNRIAALATFCHDYKQHIDKPFVTAIVEYCIHHFPMGEDANTAATSLIDSFKNEPTAIDTLRNLFSFVEDKQQLITSEDALKWLRMAAEVENYYQSYLAAADLSAAEKQALIAASEKEIVLLADKAQRTVDDYADPYHPPFKKLQLLKHGLISRLYILLQSPSHASDRQKELLKCWMRIKGIAVDMDKSIVDRGVEPICNDKMIPHLEEIENRLSAGKSAYVAAGKSAYATDDFLNSFAAEITDEKITWQPDPQHLFYYTGKGRQANYCIDIFSGKMWKDGGSVLQKEANLDDNARAILHIKGPDPEVINSGGALLAKDGTFKITRPGVFEICYHKPFKINGTNKEFQYVETGSQGYPTELRVFSFFFQLWVSTDSNEGRGYQYLLTTKEGVPYASGYTEEGKLWRVDSHGNMTKEYCYRHADKALWPLLSSYNGKNKPLFWCDDATDKVSRCEFFICDDYESDVTDFSLSFTFQHDKEGIEVLSNTFPGYRLSREQGLAIFNFKPKTITLEKIDDPRSKIVVMAKPKSKPDYYVYELNEATGEFFSRSREQMLHLCHQMASQGSYEEAHKLFDRLKFDDLLGIEKNYLKNIFELPHSKGIALSLQLKAALAMPKGERFITALTTKFPQYLLLKGSLPHGHIPKKYILDSMEEKEFTAFFQRYRRYLFQPPLNNKVSHEKNDLSTDYMAKHNAIFVGYLEKAVKVDVDTLDPRLTVADWNGFPWDEAIVLENAGALLELYLNKNDSPDLPVVDMKLSFMEVWFANTFKNKPLYEDIEGSKERAHYCSWKFIKILKLIQSDREGFKKEYGGADAKELLQFFKHDELPAVKEQPLSYTVPVITPTEHLIDQEIRERKGYLRARNNAAFPIEKYAERPLGQLFDIHFQPPKEVALYSKEQQAFALTKKIEDSLFSSPENSYAKEKLQALDNAFTTEVANKTVCQYTLDDGKSLAKLKRELTKAVAIISSPSAPKGRDVYSPGRLRGQRAGGLGSDTPIHRAPKGRYVSCSAATLDEIEKLANYPSDDEIALLSKEMQPAAIRHKVKVKAGQIEAIDFHRHILFALMAKNSAMLKEMNPFLTEGKIHELFSKSLLYLLDISKKQQITQALDLIKQADSGSADEGAIVQQLGEILHRQRHYDPYEYPELLAYEYATGMMLRSQPNQAALLIKIFAVIADPASSLEQRGSLRRLFFEFQAGGGKTKVLSVLIAMRAMLEGKVPVFFALPDLEEISNEDLSHALQSTFAKKTFSSKIRLQSNPYNDALSQYYDELVAAKKYQRCQVMVPEAYHALNLQRQQALLADNVGLDKIDILNQILDFYKEEAIFLIDEGHKNSDSLLQANIAFGNPERLPPHQKAFFFDVFDLLCGNGNGKKPLTIADGRSAADVLGAADNRQALATDEERDAVLKSLAKRLTKMGKLSVDKDKRKELVNYWLDPTAKEPVWLQERIQGSDKEQKQAELIYLARGLLTEVLPHTLSLVEKMNYGLSPNSHDPVESPYSQLKPSCAKFEDADIAAQLTVQGAYQRGIVTTHQLEKLVQILSLERERLVGQGQDSGDTDVEKQFLQWQASSPNKVALAEIKQDFYKSDKAKHLVKVIGKNRDAIKYFLLQYALNSVRVYPYKLTSTASDLLGAPYAAVDFSATLGAKEKYPYLADSQECYLEDLAFLAEVAQRATLEHNARQVWLNAKEPRALLQGLYESDPEGFDKLEGIVNIGGLCKEYPSVAFSDAFIALQKSFRSAIKNPYDAVLYSKTIAASGSKPETKKLFLKLIASNELIEIPGSNVREELKKRGLEKLRLFKIFAPDDTTGSDWPFSSSAKAAILLGEGVTFSNLAQGIMRLRAFLAPTLAHDKGQSLLWVGDAKLKTQIESVSRGSSPSHICLWTLINDASLTKEAIIAAAYQEIECVVRKLVMDEVDKYKEDPEKQSQLFKEHADAFRILRQRNLRERYGLSRGSEDTEKVLRSYLTSFCKAAKVTIPVDSAEEQRIDGVIAQTKKIIAATATVTSANVQATALQQQQAEEVSQQHSKQKQKQKQKNVSGLEGLNAREGADYASNELRLEAPELSKESSTQFQKTNTLFKTDLLCDDLYLMSNTYEIVREKSGELPRIKPIPFLLIVKEEVEGKAVTKAFAVSAKDADAYADQLNKGGEGIAAAAAKRRCLLLTADGTLAQRQRGCYTSQEVEELQQSHWLKKIIADTAVISNRLREVDTLERQMQANKEAWAKLYDKVSAAHIDDNSAFATFVENNTQELDPDL